MASSSSKSPPPLPLPRRSPQFTPIEEERELEDTIMRSTPTPINHNHNHKKKTSESEEDGSVSCNKCRPHAHGHGHGRDKIFILPLDHSNSKNKLAASPNGNIFRSLVSKLTRKSPMSTSSSSQEEKWKMAVAELSHKLLHATRKRDDALLQASRLMQSMADLEKKLNKLELYCHTLKSGLEQCTSKPHDTLIQHFLVSVSEARSCVRLLSRSLTMQLRHMGTKVHDRLSFLLQPYDIKISSSSSKTLLFYLEALLNRTFFEDFETIGFHKNASYTILNPTERCQASFECFNMLQGLTWEEVLSKGTRHFSQDLSSFCDRKMSEIVSMLGWNRAWPEPLLQAFFGASKSVWMLHLLANSVHPSFPIFRVHKGVHFDSLYMEDMDTHKHTPTLLPAVVRIMVAPGFYVYGSAVKCKVLCSYFTSQANNTTNTNKAEPNKPFTPTPS
ncbi:hypothetical protein VNO78_10011 [Psophocarpus tetragonolobus]|uniref:IRK-interacting protein n=1 Tax=Psophocarpus tetragonolobus TaxID=3891 RepID=A0AAN9SK25_PSOTE